MGFTAETDGASAPVARIVAVGAERYVVHVCGAFAQGWSGSLARELASRRISIARGWARRSLASTWEAQLVLHVLDPRVNPFQIDFLALARTSAAPRRLDLGPRLEAYRLERTRHDLELTIRAPDGVGLLDALLATLAFYALYPHEMTIDTRGGLAHDLFRLHRVGGGVPSEVVTAALEQTLHDLTRER